MSNRRMWVMPDRFARGESVPLQCFPSVEEAFTHVYSTNAHGVMYDIPSEEGPIGRLLKGNLAQYIEAGSAPQINLLMVDIDRAGHAAHPPDGPAELPPFPEGLDNPTLVYNTTHGWRVVYELTRPITPAQTEGALKGLIDAFTDQFSDHDDLVVDWRCNDWVRIFLMPMVVRDGERFAPKLFKANWDAKLDPTPFIRDISVSDLPAATPTSAPYDGDMPDQETLEAILGQTDTVRAMLDATAGRAVGRFLRGTAPLYKGERDDGLTRHVGSACCHLWPLKEDHGITEEHVYALFHRSRGQVEMWEEDGFDRKCWSLVCRFWANERGKEDARREEYARRDCEVDDIRAGILQGMRQWDQRVPDDADEAWEYALQRMIVILPRQYLIMQPNGYYSKEQYPREAIIPMLRRTHMDRVVDTYNTKGGDRSITAVLNRHSISAGSILGKPGTSSAKGAYLHPVDSIGYRHQVRLPLYARANIQPQFDEDVDAWLRVMFGDQYDLVAKWIAWALAWDEGPIAGLSIIGPPGCGKGMLVRGLAECLQVPVVATPNDMVHQFQSNLLHTPFLNVNEGWPLGKVDYSPADRFRAYTAGDPLSVNEKFLTPIEVHSPIRIILTANNTSVIKKLTGQQDLNSHDREAIAQRLIHVQASPAATDWLATRGGRKFTSREGRRWITDGARESDFVVARHFLHLYANRGETPSGRFLMEGDISQPVIDVIRTQSGSSPVVVQAILGMATSGRAFRPDMYLGTEGDVYVSVDGVLRYWQSHLMCFGTPSIDAIRNVLDALTLPGEKPGGCDVMVPGIGLRRRHRLDVQLLNKQAEELGRGSEWLRKLEQMWSDQRAAKGEADGGA